MPLIFISYRRADAPYPARQIYERLITRYGEGSTFLDIDTVPPGIDFRAYINEKVSECHVMLVIIGDAWLDRDANGKTKLQSSSDLVRLEIEAALRAGKVLVPVLVETAEIPTKADLPKPISILPDLNAVEVRPGSSFEGQMVKLLNELDSLLPKGSRRRNKLPLVFAAASTAWLLSLLIMAGAWWLDSNHLPLGLFLKGRLGTVPFPLPEMVMIEPGKFTMGDHNGDVTKALPTREVEILKPFMIGKYEVTFDQYEPFALAVPDWVYLDDQKWGKGKLPAINLNWGDAKAYAKWLSLLTGDKYRLPTEAEWEYAARAGTTTRYWWGDEMKDGMASNRKRRTAESVSRSVKVGSYEKNDWGLFDTVGNVSEWVEDCFHETYKNAPLDGRAWGVEDDGDCDRRMKRGGSFLDDAADSILASRHEGARDFRYINHGLRLVRDP